MINISDKEFEYLSTFVRNNYGINLTEKKKAWWLEDCRIFY